MPLSARNETLGNDGNLKGQRVYFDANIFIYWQEDVPVYAEKLASVFSWLQANEIEVVTNELPISEVLQKPLKDDAKERQEAYLTFLQTRASLTVAPISREILIEAARQRELTWLPLPDAIHIATALQTACLSFLTNDQRLAAKVPMQVVVLSQV